jgi:alpha,alpha-trehalose phosphorylase
MTPTTTPYRVEPWALREVELDLDGLARSESIFALANGHIGLRGNLDEGEPHGMPGTYLSGFFESRPFPIAEAGFGDPEAGQTIVNVSDGKVIRLLVDDEPFDVRYGVLRSHERVLDFRSGALRRTLEWESPAGNAVRITSTRLVSFVQRAVAAVLWEVEPLDCATRVVVQSELVANQPVPSPAHSDPRRAATIGAALEAEDAVGSDLRAVLVHLTKQSRLRVAAGMDHVVSGPSNTEASTEIFADLGRMTAAASLEAGERLQVIKFLAYGWSGGRSLPALRAQVSAALAEARQTTWDGLLSAQRAYLDEFWDRADVEVDGDAPIQQAIRFALFHVLQAGARSEGRAISSKGLTGPGYDGHAFWDTESFVLPVLTYTHPSAAVNALRWRHSTLTLAQDRARLLGLAGAAFPWRTIAGEECSGYWPAVTAAFHIGADIADAVERYQHAADDPEFELRCGLELLVETARLWRSLGHHDSDGRFRIDGVTGPDEYGAIADNNVYTNLMAQRNLRAAADAAERHRERAEELGVDSEETASWRDAARTMLIPYDENLGVHPQAEEFTEHQRWDFSATGADQYPLLLHFPYFDLYRKQVVKQADLVLALHVCGDAFTPEEKARNFTYYEALTVRDSSLSACTQAVVAAEVGHLDLAYDYFGEAALLDINDRERNTSDGVHIASLAGTWIAAVAGFGGMRDHQGRLSFTPRLPAALTRLTFRMIYRGRCLVVEVAPTQVIYRLVSGEPLEVDHYGEALVASVERPEVRPVPALVALLKPPTQPDGRAPAPRGRT